MRNLEAIFIKQRNIEYCLQLITTIITDISSGTMRLQKIIPLLPDTDGMGFYTGEIFKIFYGEDIHEKEKQLQIKKVQPAGINSSIKLKKARHQALTNQGF
jgi:hypothetical protein